MNSLFGISVKNCVRKDNFQKNLFLEKSAYGTLKVLVVKTSAVSPQVDFSRKRFFGIIFSNAAFHADSE